MYYWIACKYIYTLLTISARAVSIWNRFHHQLKHLCFFSSVEPSSVISRPDPSSTSRHAGRNFHEVFQLRQGGYSDLPSSKISDMMKSTSLDVSTVYLNIPVWIILTSDLILILCITKLLLQNAPTQSLLSVVNGILDEIIERKNGEIPYVGYSKAMQLVYSFHTLKLHHILLQTLFILLNMTIVFFAQHLAFLLRKIVLEVERRISTQAEHIRNVRSTYSHLFFRLFLL